MKRILVPTDFSPIATNAIEYAIEIATHFKSELYLYHVYSVSRVDYDLGLPAEEQPFVKEFERKMALTEIKFSEEFERRGITVHTMVERSDILALFGSKVRELKIDMIVMGSKGASGIEKVVFGSVAATALNLAKVPVLVIPPRHSFRSIEDIVLAIDDREVSREVLLPLQKLALSFSAVVTVLRAKSNGDAEANKNISLQSGDLQLTYRQVPVLNSVNESINYFVEKEGCDLLCMVRRKKGFLESLFKRSITKAQVFDSRVPLLVLPEGA